LLLYGWESWIGKKVKRVKRVKKVKHDFLF
jgi:hypothetical protein